MKIGISIKISKTRRIKTLKPVKMVTAEIIIIHLNEI